LTPGCISGILCRYDIPSGAVHDIPGANRKEYDITSKIRKPASSI
jgi:hypothetical protein